jgi:hypothetical protein
MPDFDRRHVEHFGPDLARGPVLSGQPEVAAVQIAAALAQLRVPLARSDADIAAHAAFIRTLADTLFPDYAAGIRFDVGAESGNQITTQLRVETTAYTLLHCWLADSVGGGETSVAPGAVSWLNGEVVQVVTSKKQWLLLVPTTGFVSVEITEVGEHTWYWAAARHGRVYYSSKVQFTT